MLQMFHLNILKVDRDVVQRRWLMDSGLPQPPVAAVGV
jgi:hypothetical protein